MEGVMSSSSLDSAIISNADLIITLSKTQKTYSYITRMLIPTLKVVLLQETK